MLDLRARQFAARRWSSISRTSPTRRSSALEIPTGQPIVYELDDDLSVERALLSEGQLRRPTTPDGSRLSCGTFARSARRSTSSDRRRRDIRSIATLSGSDLPVMTRSRSAAIRSISRAAVSWQSRCRRRHGRAGSRTRRRRCAPRRRSCGPRRRAAARPGSARRRRRLWPKLSLIVFSPSRSTNSIAAWHRVAADAVDQPFELAHEVAAIGQIDERIAVRAADRAAPTRSCSCADLSRRAVDFRRSADRLRPLSAT